MKIGIIGVGFVGRAILAAYNNSQVEVVCRDPHTGYNASIEDIKQTDFVFVCVPSPSRVDGSCDTSLLESVLYSLTGYTGIIISKVTAPPSVYLELQAKHNNLIYAPEFLTAANAVNDYKNSKFIIVGGKDAMCQLALPAILVGVNPDATVKQTDIATASLAKYTINSFLATKVAFMNEIYDVATATNIDYSELSELVTLDSRIGASHMRVPGPDGSRGFAGGCFPKDTEALAYYANEIGKDLTILEKAIESNLITKANQ